MTIACQHIHTPMGTMLLAARDEGLVGVWFDGQRHLPDTSGWSHRTAHPVLKATETQLLQYMQGERQTFDLPLCPAWGTPFQQTVWQALRGIDFGRVTSYGQMAIDLNRPQAARAIGAAVGRNPWSVVVPCHRVLGSQGRLTGYAGGLDRKLALLTLEGVMH